MTIVLDRYYLFCGDCRICKKVPIGADLKDYAFRCKFETIVTPAFYGFDSKKGGDLEVLPTKKSSHFPVTACFVLVARPGIEPGTS